MKYCLVLSLLCFICVSVNAEYVTIENKEGIQIEVELLAYENGQVEFALRNGHKHTYNILDLTMESRDLIREWAEQANKVVLTPNHRIKVDVFTNRRSNDTDGGYTGWKDIDERIEPRVLVTNEEYREAFNGLKATVVLIGEDVTNSRELKVLYKDSFDFSVARNSQFEWEGKAFTLDYLVDDNDGYDNSRGHKYRYFFVVIRNKDGSVGHAAASINKWTRDPGLIDRLEVDQITDRDLL